MAEKKSAQELFKDYTPEIMEYDPSIERGAIQASQRDRLSEEERLKDDLIRLKAKAEAAKMAEGKSLDELLRDYVPETMYYDPEIDGGDEHMIRDAHLSEKERLKDVITRLKQKNRGDRKVRR